MSRPSRAFKIKKERNSFVVRIVIPTVSKLCEFVNTPIVDTAPCEGLNPKTPQ